MCALLLLGYSVFGAMSAHVARRYRCAHLFWRDVSVRVRDRDAWQQRCSVGRMMCAQLPLDSQVWRHCKEPN